MDSRNSKLSLSVTTTDYRKESNGHEDKNKMSLPNRMPTRITLRVATSVSLNDRLINDYI